MARTSTCYRCNRTLTGKDYDLNQDAFICYVCTMPDPDNPDKQIPTVNKLEPVDYRDMGIRIRIRGIVIGGESE